MSFALAVWVSGFWVSWFWPWYLHDIVHRGRTFLPRKNLCKLPIDKSHIMCYNRS
jgi:hypothetical protein